MKPLFVVAIMALSSMFSCSENGDRQLNTPDADAEKDDKQLDGGATDLLTRTLVHDGMTREYFLYVPDSYDGTSEVPLMLNFHGYGGIASQYLEYADMRSLADTEMFILVYPQGALLDGDPHWNAGLESDENKSDVDDFGFVEALIDEISSNYSIDPARVYACGYSNGAFFTYALACYHGDRIAAIGSVAGTMMEETHDNCSPSHPTAMINTVHQISSSPMTGEARGCCRSMRCLLSGQVSTIPALPRQKTA